ncbi:MAG: hypothetical protein A3E74_07960 [Omnitrophica bacterium RIFCSPHIGHO2_12_FULL_44_12]|nr:MAG: hypothetical protein A3B72_10440 [Omnitrophica bacterium RIFCSPHIGHO2_02_FULL_45_28]OGW89541.1 MAG: hypothetical protein A3E74_07960 [Omnitrophica bacterium RIFCSPHIGHO2_12_FULL_44_12]OGX01710.1 MAG: hypothetical protein A3J12_04205 [Omnitrophica bacterium RIFCSPLOWO2_02_FULL_44_11]
MGAISYAQSFAPLLNQGAKDKPCVAKMNTLFAPQLLRAEFLINDEKSGLNRVCYAKNYADTLL